MTDNYYKPHIFTINKTQSSHINKRVYEDRQGEDSKRKYPNGQRSEYIRKLIEEDMRGGDDT